MLVRAKGEALSDFCSRARSWFGGRSELIRECAVATRSFLLANRGGYNFDGTQRPLAELIVPDFPRDLSRFLNGENIANARLRGQLSGLWQMLDETAAQRLTPPTEGLHGLLLTEGTLQLFRDLEFKRLRPLPEVDTLKDVMARYRASLGDQQGGGKDLHRFGQDTITPMVAFGLVDARMRGRSYDVVSGPVLIAFTTEAFLAFLDHHRL